VPKVIGVSYAERLAPVQAPLLSFMTVALTPFIAVTEWVSRPFKREDGKRRLSIADLRTMADMARHDRVISAEEENIIINATKLRQMTVSAVMVPRERVVLFDARQPNISNFEVAASSLHTRYPVSRDGTVEGIVGYVNFKEIVGDLTDEFDQLSEEIIEVAPRRWKIGGGARLRQVIQQTALALSVDDPDKLLSDWLQQRVGREPQVGDTVKQGAAQFTVIQTRRRKAHRVLVEPAASHDRFSVPPAT